MLQAEQSRRLQQFMQRFTQHLCDSLYPGAPPMRKHLALCLLHMTLDQFKSDSWVAHPAHSRGAAGSCAREGTECQSDGSVHGASANNRTQAAEPGGQHAQGPCGCLTQFDPFCASLRSAALVQVCFACSLLHCACVVTNEGKWMYATSKSVNCAVFLGPGLVGSLDLLSEVNAYGFCHMQTLLAATVDSWEQTRAAAISVLQALGIPLPGMDTPARAAELLAWAQQLTLSPRPHEADAGARLVALVHAVYVQGLGWSAQRLCSLQSDASEAQHAIRLSAPQATVAPSSTENDRFVKAARPEFLELMVQELEQALQAARRNMLEACRHNFLQGRLLAVRYVCQTLPWQTIFASAVLVRTTHITSGACLQSELQGLCSESCVR
jgi:hypothetical protein